MFRKIEISVQTILFTVALIAGIWLLLQIKDILFLVFIAFLLMTAIYPMVMWLDRLKIPRAISTLLIYFVVLGVLGVIIGSAVPALVTQSTKLAATLPGTAARVFPYWNIDFQTISGQLAPLSANVLSLTLGIFSNIFTTFTVLIVTFYFILERRRAEATLTGFLGEATGRKVTELIRITEHRLGAWVRGELLLMTFVGVLTYIGLTLLHIEFALPLAIIAGLLEIVPMIGPIISSVPAVLVALAISPVLALSVAALYVVVQQVESNIFVPIVMKRSVGLSPLVTILALMIGGRLGGIGGAVLAVPSVLVLQVILTSLLGAKNPAK
ncbi:MAG: AI-2E family transporter [Candidatus Gottesmanbacteria bacterium]|nr:AI-2E family transporter [Candidatus Gottesmanbacteria bacterium]